MWRWDQDEPFGANAANTDPDGDAVAFDLPLRFAGQRYDAESGLHYNYYRDYDPSIGRYGESDPIGLRGGLDSYGYGNQNPLTYVDPRGEVAGAAVVIGGAALIVGAAIALSSPAGKKAAASIAKAIQNACTPKDDDESCQSHFKKCLDSGWGGQVGFDSACFACFQRCQGTGQWPDSVTSGLRGQFPVSCEYWLKR